MPPKAASTDGAAKKKTSPPAHPPYATMVKAAIASLKERTGSSSIAIWKYIEGNYQGVSKTHMASQLKKMVEKGKLVKVKASFKLSESFKSKGAVGTKRRMPWLFLLLLLLFASFKRDCIVLFSMTEDEVKPKKVAKKPAAVKPKKPAAKKPVVKKTTATKPKKTPTKPKKTTATKAVTKKTPTKKPVVKKTTKAAAKPKAAAKTAKK